MRTTQKDIRQVESIINTEHEKRGLHPIIVQWAYGQPRAHLVVGEHGAVRDLSPRLPTGEMYRWLCAYLTGLRA